MHRRQRAGIAADAGESRVSQADLAGVAGQDDDAGDRQRVDENRRAHAEVIAGGEEQRGDGDQRGQDDQRPVFR
ncbi:Uncharacterised protein [Bordetella pertussis]|nr:Uncharacterised protein [Bordetella pertussis]